MNAFFGFLRDFWRELWPVRVIYSYQRGVRFWKGRVNEAQLEPGLHLVCPYFGEIQIVNVAEDYLDLAVQSITTKDGKSVSFSANVGFTITDAVQNFCNIQDFESNMGRAATNHLARKVRGWTWDELCEYQTELERSLRETLTTKARKWGVTILEVGLTDLVQARQYRML